MQKRQGKQIQLRIAAYDSPKEQTTISIGEE
jgi:hypothetical protein